MLYRDGLVVVLDKPAGLSCTPGQKGDWCLTDHLQELTFGKTTLPQVAHRLDRETTGCLVLGRHPKALRLLGELFQKRRVVKTYWALVSGHWQDDQQILDEPIEGQEAITEVTCLHRGEGWSWLQLRPKTGRTHQLRIHCSEQGHPILGDTRYSKQGAGEGLMLHAHGLQIPLSKNKPPVVVEAPLPGNWSRIASLV